MNENTGPAENWVDVLAPFDAWNERVLMALFALLGKPASYLDVGSGTGAMVNLAHRMGVDAWGVDQLVRPDAWLLARNLCEPLDLGRTFDMVTSIEVAEHIPIEHDATFCDSVARHVGPGGILIFTAAHPGQGGETHVNCRPAPYWRRMFFDRGLMFTELQSLRVAHIWQTLRSPAYWLTANVQVFAR